MQRTHRWPRAGQYLRFTFEQFLQSWHISEQTFFDSKNSLKRQEARKVTIVLSRFRSL